MMTQIEVTKGRAVLYTLFSALLLALALPNELLPGGNALLALICLVPYFRALYGCRRIGAAMRLGALFGIVSTILNHYWLMFFGSFSLWTITSVALGYGLWHLLLGGLLWLFLRMRRQWRPFAVGALWASHEFLKSIGYVGFPWGLIAHPGTSVPLLTQHIDITGIWALSFLTAVFNVIIVDLIYSRRPRRLSEQKRALGFAVGLLLLMSIYGITSLGRDIPIRDYMRVTLVQQNRDSWAVDQEVETLRANQLLTHAALREHSEPADLVVWSETSLRFPYPQWRGFYQREPAEQPFRTFLRQIDTALLTGVPYIDDHDPEQVYNAAILLNPQGEIVDYYGKRHLVPFAEHIPFWEFEVVRRLFKEYVGLNATWAIGSRATIFPLSLQSGAAVRFGALICFEDSFAELARDITQRGAQVLINLTNNSWSRTDSAQIQHLVSARLRAVENRISLVRATNSGVSTVIDAYGNMHGTLPGFETAFLNAEVPIYADHPPTFYNRFGDWLGILFCAICMALMITAALAYPLIADDQLLRL